MQDVRIPAVRERVRIEGRDGDFTVVFVDVDRQVADLIGAMPWVLVEDVPFNSLTWIASDMRRG